VLSGLQDDWDVFSYPLYLKIKEQTPEMQDLAAIDAGLSNASVRRSGDNSPARLLMREYISGNYFEILGVGSGLGRKQVTAIARESANRKCWHCPRADLQPTI